MTYTITATLTLDAKHPNVPSLDDCILAVEQAILTPDNSAYGILEVSVTGEEMKTDAELPEWLR